jgi:hypothetical protein
VGIVTVGHGNYKGGMVFWSGVFGWSYGWSEMGFLPRAENDGVGGGMTGWIKGVLEFWRWSYGWSERGFLPWEGMMRWRLWDSCLVLRMTRCEGEEWRGEDYEIPALCWEWQKECGNGEVGGMKNEEKEGNKNIFYARIIWK